MSKKIRLGVNVDHIAFIKQARKTNYPSLVDAVKIAEGAGADLITIHLREDRRHIQDKDLFEIRKNCKVLNLEMALTKEMVDIALKNLPNYCCIVPEKREELTTEGGLDLISMSVEKTNYLIKTIEAFREKNIITSLFIDPDFAQIDRSKEVGSKIIELHTGTYAEVNNDQQKKIELDKLKSAARYAHEKDLIVNAGHGLDYKNVKEICNIDYLNELNIGHSIIAESVFIGLDDAIKKMISIISNCD